MKARGELLAGVGRAASRVGTWLIAIGITVGLQACLSSPALAWDFYKMDVVPWDGGGTALTVDHATGLVNIGVMTSGVFYVLEPTYGSNWLPRLVSTGMKSGPGTVALINYPPKTDSYRPTFATIRYSDGMIMVWYRGGNQDEWYLQETAGNGAHPAVTVSLAKALNVEGTCFAFTRSNGELWFLRKVGTTSDTQLIATNVEGTPSIALASDGKARIAYRDGSTGRIVFAAESSESGGGWGWMYVSTGDGDSPSLRIDSTNRPMIAFHSSQGLMFAQGAGFPTSAFLVTNVLAGGPETGTSPSLRLTGDTNFPWIASGDANASTVSLTQRLGGIGEPWVTTTVAQGLSFPKGIFLTIDGNLPKLSWTSPTGGVDYATAGVWVAKIQDQGVEGQTFQATWGGIGPVIVEGSTDGGTSWQSLSGEVSVSPAVFTLPAVQTNAARVRIRRVSDGEVAVSPNTFRIVPRTTPPNPISQVRWAAPGSGPERRGFALADAGDVNGDGYDDIIAGAPLNASAGSYTGRAYLYFGGPASDAIADLTLNGPEAGSLFGESVAGVGDLNHDGYADFAVGAPYFTLPAVQTGRVYVYFGGPLLDATADLVLSGTALGETFGQSVAGLGDVNGDGYDDLAVGAPAHAGASGTLQHGGRVDLFFGAPSPDAARDLSIEGAAAFDEFGYSVAGGGDVNGDGAPDFVVGAHYGDGTAGTESGTLYLFLGGRLMDRLADAIQHGTEAGGQLGTSVAIVGDVNGDGLADISAGAPYEAGGAGRVYLWGGSSSWINPGPPELGINPGPPDTGVSPGPPDFGISPGPPNMVLAGEMGDQLGTSVAGLGDLNGDCFADVGFGAPAYGADNQGRAYVVLGGTDHSPGARAVLEGRAADGLGGAMAGLRNAGAGSARMVVSGLSAGGSRSGDGGLSLFDFSRFIVQSPSGGGTWPVGALREVKWLGRERANVELSADGGATWTTLLENVGGQGINVASIRVPHTPTRFARIRVTPPSPVLPPNPVVPPNPVLPPSPIVPPSPICSPEAWVAVSDSFFTIQTSVSLLALLAAPAPGGAGAVVTWSSDPGPADLAGYRLERASGNGSWATVTPLTRETAFTDAQAGPATRYRLFAVNGLNEELLLGETSFRPRAPLAAWPLPYRSGEMSIAFATHGGWGGGAGRSELTLFDVRGRLVRKIADGPFEAGYRTVTWDGRDEQGQRVATGMYFLRSKSAGEERTLKVVVAR